MSQMISSMIENKLNLEIEEEPNQFVYYISTGDKCYVLRWPKRYMNDEVIARQLTDIMTVEEFGWDYYYELKEIIGKLLSIAYRKNNLNKDFCQQ